jgi:hypothetical protein
MASQNTLMPSSYDALVVQLRKCLLKPREIEILPLGTSLAAGEHFLFDEDCIGIPKITLVAAFLHARNVVMSSRDVQDNVCMI